MTKYRKKPVVIEAFRPDIDVQPDWFYAALDADIAFTRSNGELVVQSLEGPMLVSSGDYIVKGVKDELYPCKPDIFELTYEKVED